MHDPDVGIPIKELEVRDDGSDGFHKRIPILRTDEHEKHVAVRRQRK
jgi:hypothetical protein